MKSVAAEKFYSIKILGPEAPVLQFGELNKVTGAPKGQTYPGRIPVGTISLPNYSRVWGKMEVKEGKETGNVEFLDWGNPEGSVVEIRYLANSRSLSKQYQDNIQKLKPAESELEIVLLTGVNNFSYDTDALKIEFLKHHTYNKTNASRDPKNEEIHFEEYSSNKNLKSRFEASSTREKAEAYLKDAWNDEGMARAMARTFGLDEGSQVEDILDELFNWMERDTKQFMHIIADATTTAKAIYERAQEYGLIDSQTIKNEILVLLPGKMKDKLFTDIEDWAEDKLKFVLDNYFRPKNFDGFTKLKSMVEKYEIDKLDQ